MTIYKFLAGWVTFNLIPLFFPNPEVNRLFFDSRRGFNFWWEYRFLDIEGSKTMFDGIYGWVNLGFLVLFVWMLFGLYLAFKRGAIYKDPTTGKTIYEGPTKTTEL